MPIEEKWYDGKYYNQVQIIQEEEEYDEKQPYWGIKHGTVTVESPSPSLLSVMSGKSSVSAAMRVTIMEQEQDLDSFEKEMVARIAASALLTKKQLTDYLELCGRLPLFYDPIIESGIMRRRLNKLFDLELIEKVILSYSNGLPEHTAYRITRLGQELASRQGVCIHKGNMYQSDNQRMKTGLLDTPAEIMRILVANNIAIRLLKKSEDIHRLDFLTTHYLKGIKTMTNITTSALSIVKEDGSAILYEVFRRPDKLDQHRAEYENYVKAKVRRYFGLVQNEDFIDKNSQNLKAIPKLAIVAEDPAHIDELEKLLTPIINVLQVDKRAEVVFITDYGVDTGIVYQPNFSEEDGQISPPF